MDPSFCVHAVFPNYYDGTRVSYSLKSILKTMASPEGYLYRTALNLHRSRLRKVVTRRKAAH